MIKTAICTLYKHLLGLWAVVKTVEFGPAKPGNYVVKTQAPSSMMLTSDTAPAATNAKCLYPVSTNVDTQQHSVHPTIHTSRSALLAYTPAVARRPVLAAALGSLRPRVLNPGRSNSRA